MTINLTVPPVDGPLDLRPRITVIGVGGAGGNAVNNMIRSSLQGVEFVVANTDSQSLSQSAADRRVQLGTTVTQGLGAGSRPEIGRIAAEEVLDDLIEELKGSNMAFIAAGMGGGTGTGAAPVIARAAREQGILTVGVVTRPFHFEGAHRMRIADSGIAELEQFVDTLIIIPNQNLFRVANERTTFADAFKMADDVLYSGVRGVTDLMVMPGMINLDFADIRAVMSEMGKAMMGTGEAEGERRALQAAEAAISNPLLDDTSMKGARGVLINITGGSDMTLFEADEAANRIRSEVDPDAFIIFGSTFDDTMDGKMRVSVVATGMDAAAELPKPTLLALGTAVGEEPRKSAAGGAAAALSVVERAASAVAGASGGTSPDTSPNSNPGYRGVAAAAGVGAEAGVGAGVGARAAADAGADPGGSAEVPAVCAPPAHDAFIPPAPVSGPASIAALRPVAPSTDAPAAGRDDPAGSGRPEASRPTKPRVANLFARMTGNGRAAARSEPESRPQVQADPAVQHADRQRRLGALSPDERLPVSQPAEDLLDIPAFLRRQAN